MTRAPLLALLLATAAPALADDPRLVERLYNPDEVVRIEGRTKVQATIAFGEDEAIENVAIGDSGAWQVTPNKRANLLFLKPLDAGARTNMTVITDKRTYLFDLVASPTAKPLYMLRFTYPKEPEAKPAAAPAGAQVAAETASPAELAAASDPYAVVDPAALNFAWERSGEAGLLPTRAYDDGTATFLTWSAGTPIPAILTRDARGTEGPVNFTVRGETIVVEGVPREIILRSGKAMATLTNAAPERTSLTVLPPALARSDMSSSRKGQ